VGVVEPETLLCRNG